MYAVYPTKDDAIREWLDKSASLRHIADDGSTPAFVRVIDLFRNAVAEFGSAARITRDNQRSAILNLPSPDAEVLAAESLVASGNDAGIHSLAAAQKQLVLFRRELHELVGKEGQPKWDDREAAADQLIRRWRAGLSQVHAHPEMLKAMDENMVRGYEIARTGTVDDLVDHLGKAFRELGDSRGRTGTPIDDSQAFVFLPWWKVLAAVATFGVFLYAFFKCGIFGCNVDEAKFLAALGAIAALVLWLC